MAWAASSQDGLDLTGIDSAINLRNLGLEGNSILDFSPLEGLTKLHTLNLIWDLRMGSLLFGKFD